MSNPTHEARIRAALESFTAASERLLQRVERATDEEAMRQPEGGGWTVAQVGHHVAVTNDVFTGWMDGTIPGAKPAPAGFVERGWPDIAGVVPARAEAPEPVKPPAVVTRADAMARLRESSERLGRAIAGLTPERAACCVNAPLVGRLSLYQLGEWATAHVARHNAQAKRILGR